MADNVKFSEEEMNKLKELQTGYLDTQNKFGQIAIARLNLRQQAEELSKMEADTQEEFNTLQSSEKDIIEEFTEKYGQGTLDPQTGVFSASEVKPTDSDSSSK